MKQSTALDILKAGHNVFLTGSAGAGKTYTLNQYIHYLKAHRVPVAVTASTGIAATHMNGMTIHTWSGIGIKDSLDSKDLKSMGQRKYLQKLIDGAGVLIIDEISMLHARQFALVNQVLQYFRETSAAFGGLQLIVAGDFFQLPPVGNRGERNRDKFCFMSPAWVEADFKICYLTEQHRQQVNDDTDSTESSIKNSTENATADNIPNSISQNNISQNSISPATINLNDILNEIRTGSVSATAITALQQTKDNLQVNTRNSDMVNDDNDITRLYTHNADVDSINQRHIQALSTAERVYNATLTGNEKLLMTLGNSVRAPENLVLKVGAKVMFVKNNFEQGYSNGTLGEVTGFYEDTETGIMPEVALKDGRRLIVTPETWSVENEKGSPIASFTQVPLCYAWAITVHKSQGMTLEQAEIDLSQTFEAGQGYVALSRLKSLEGLRLLGLNDIALKLDPLAMKADKRFLELSDDIETIYSEKSAEDIQKAHSAFITKKGGTNNAYIIDQYKSGSKKRTTHKPDTLAATKALLEESFTIAEIASKRELAESTIVSHISKLLKDVPELPIDHIKPADEVLAQVQAAYDKVKKRDYDDDKSEAGEIKLRPLFVQLNEKVPYSVIRLALLFIKS